MSSEAASGEITVIIPSWNRRELLENCLRSLQVQTLPCRVIVVDNGSTDGTAELLRKEFPEVRMIRLDHNRGFSVAVNLGIREASTPFVALLNNDTEAHPKWIEAALEAFARFPEYAFFASRMINYYDRDRLDSAGDCYSRSGLPTKRGFGLASDRFLQTEPVLGASAGAAFYRRSLFDEVGYFDEHFKIYLEDVDLSLRAQLHGMPCLYLPEAIVFHIEAASDRDFPEAKGRSGAFYSKDRVFWITRNRWLLMVIYQPVRNLPFLAYGWTKSLFFHLFKAGFSGSFLQGIWAGIRVTAYALGRRKELEQRKVISTSDLCALLEKC